MAAKWSNSILNDCIHQPQKMSNESESSADICKTASKPTYSFRINTANPNESSDATESKGMGSISGGFVGGFALSTRTKLERSGHIAGFPLTSERADRTNTRNARSSDARTVRSDPKCKFHPADGFFRYDDRISTFATWPKSHPIPAQRYVKAGFYYSGEGDKVICPWCNLNLTEWESYDIPMEEHQKHSPYCVFVLILNPFLNYHLL